MTMIPGWPFGPAKDLGSGQFARSCNGSRALAGRRGGCNFLTKNFMATISLICQMVQNVALCRNVSFNLAGPMEISSIMGSFAGHVVPGTFFSLFAFWWTWKVFHRFFLCQRSAAVGEKGHRNRYLNTASFTCSACQGRLPIEGILKIVAVILGMIGEFATGFEDGKFTHINNAQHMTMFFFFGMNGVMDLLNFYRVPLPPDLDYVSAVLGFCMEGLLFYYHLHGRAPMDVQVHMLLFYVVACCAISTALEMKYKHNVLPALGRIYFTLLQGTWFYQIGFILYPPGAEPWSQHDHRQMMIVTLVFAWHNAVIFVFMALAGTLIYMRVKKLDPGHMYQNVNLITKSEALHLSKYDAERVRHI
ncbi:unnamed protein product, partial [Meganyctiphanes norvegica]